MKVKSNILWLNSGHVIVQLLQCYILSGTGRRKVGNICFVPGTYTWTDGSSTALFASTSVWTGSALPTASPATLTDTNDWVYMTTAGKWSVTGASSSGSATTKYEV